MAKRLYVFSGPIYDESENANWLHRRSVHGDEFTGTSPEAWRLYVANATYRRGARRAEIDTQGVGRLEGEDVVLAVTGGTGKPVTIGMRAAKHPSDSRVTAGSLSPTSWTRKRSVASFREVATGGFSRKSAQK